MKRPLIRRIWGEATAVTERWRRVRWVDLLLILGIVGMLYGFKDLAGQWVRNEPAVEIDLSPLALPRYTFFSLLRGLIAYLLSLTFTLLYGYWAAKDHVAERVLVPLLDILQSIPVLSFLPVLMTALVALFPHYNIGLELVVIIAIFTGQAWNMTFSFYHSVRSVPADMREVATVFRYTWWQRFKWLELPFATVGLVWNSMMSMAGGWFFLIVAEAFTLGNRDFRVPGIGAYMKVAQAKDDYGAMIWGIVAMGVMIVLLDQLLWRPVVVWAQKFRIEEGGEQVEMTSWFLDLLRRSQIVTLLQRWFGKLKFAKAEQALALTTAKKTDKPASAAGTWISRLFFVALVVALAYGAWVLLAFLFRVEAKQWLELVLEGLATLGRVMVAVVAATAWALPAGLAIGLSPRLSRALQPTMQFLASFPAPMLYALVLAATTTLGISLNFSSILLMLLGTQWYILFNVSAGAMAIPADLREAARSYRLPLLQRFRVLYFPAVFPYLVTGWVTAAGGAWNASIISEYVGKGVAPAFGLGARITEATDADDKPLMAASVLVMATMVVVFNRLVWKRCYRLAETRFSLEK